MVNVLICEGSVFLPTVSGAYFMFVTLINQKSFVLYKEPHMELSWPLTNTSQLCHKLTSPIKTFTWLSSVSLGLFPLIAVFSFYNHGLYEKQKKNVCIDGLIFLM